jgi:hypothetical protein
VGDSLTCGIGRQANAEFLRFDFLWTTDFHKYLPGLSTNYRADAVQLL